MAACLICAYFVVSVTLRIVFSYCQMLVEFNVFRGEKKLNGRDANAKQVARRCFWSGTGSSSFGWVYCGSHNFSAASWEALYPVH